MPWKQEVVGLTPTTLTKLNNALPIGVVVARLAVNQEGHVQVVYREPETKHIKTHQEFLDYQTDIK